MIDLSAFPMPPEAPPPGRCVRLERPEPGLVVLRLDPPHRSLAVLDAPLLRDLDLALDEVEAEKGLKGLVLTGRDPLQFAAGADIEAIRSLDDPALAEEVVQAVHTLFLRLERLPCRTVAAVGGPVPGGAFEISLCCDRIVAAEHPKTRIGLPEVLLGILPGWGGCHRLPERAGLPGALQAILTGRLYPARKALRAGLVDRVTWPEYLLRVASDVALGRESLPGPRRGWRTWLVDRNPAARALIRNRARKQTLARTRGHYPAPLKAIGLITEAPGVSRAEAALREARAIGELATGPVCKNLVEIFLSKQAAEKLGKDSRVRFEQAGVLGAGVMGGAIASALAERGIATRLMDLSQEALDAALIRHRADVEKRRRRRSLQRHEALAAVDRLDTSTELAGFGRVQIVIEAVAEVLEVKRKVFAQVAEQAPPEAILATNTSSLSVSRIAEGMPHPERFCGMHFFNPVKKMPLVEVVRGRETSEETVQAVAALAKRLGKTPVIVKDVAGFLVNRILGPYLDEAGRLFTGGADPSRLDRLMLDFGMPMGPLALLDEVGLDIARHAAASLHEAYGARMKPGEGLEALAGPERLGRKTGLGFYKHPPGKGRKAKPALAEDLTRFQTGTWARGLGDEELVDRMVLSMVNEAARCLEEEVVAGPAELDLATVFGTGFAPFRGGLLRYADSLGAQEAVRRLERILESPDIREREGGVEKFSPAPLLRELAASGGRFHDAGS